MAGDNADSYALRLLVAAGWVSQEKATEALNIALGLQAGPLPTPMAGDENEWVRVPRDVFAWLMGENGEFECPPHRYFRNKPPAYWWRSELERRIAAAAPAPEAACLWTFDDDGRAPMWNSACGESWSFTEGGPEDNSYRYCHGCGKPITALALPAQGGE